MKGNQAIVSRAIDRSRLGKARMRSRTKKQRKSIVKAGTDTDMRIKKVHVRHRTEEAMKRKNTVRQGTGKPLEMNRTTRDKTDKHTKRINTISNNRINKTTRRKIDINNPEDPSKAILTEKNST